MLLQIEAKLARPLARLDALSPCLDEVAALANRYLPAGGTLGELHARFNEARTSLNGRLFIAEGVTPGRLLPSSAACKQKLGAVCEGRLGMIGNSLSG